MTPRHQVSRAAIELIKRFEGFRAKAAELDDGRWTIGYGHTKTARAGTQVVEADAEALLLYDLINVAHAVNEWTYAPLNQNQFDALVSFAFNIGLENFRRSTTLRRINEGRMLEAALTMELWRRADFDGERIVIDALVRRRSFEKSLFLKPVDAWAPAPSPVLPPKIDYDVAPFTLTSPPAVLKADLHGDRAIAERAAPATFVPLEDTTTPTASEAAAAAVTAKLGALLADGDGLKAIEAAMVETPAAVAERAARHPLLHATLRPMPGPVPSRDTPSQDTRTPAALIEAEGQELPRDIEVVSTDPVATVEDERVAPRETDLAFTPKATAAKTEPVSVMVWVGLALLGLALFAAAIQFGFKTPPASSVGGLDPLVLGLGLGVLGIACAAVAVYMLLMRLAGPETPKA